MLRPIVSLTIFFVLVHNGFAQTDEKDRTANKPVTPFRIVGNLYYVGAAEVTSYLITTPEGHFLLDGGYAETAPQIEHNIAELGFKLTDVKFLLNSHAHFDHAGGLAELKKATGAKFLASERDAALLRSGGRGDFRFGDSLTFPPVTPDQIVRDGEGIQLGKQKMVPHLTPGHTKGCITWTTQIDDGIRVYNVVFIGSQSALDYKFVGQESYPGIKRDFERSFALLKDLPCDVFLATHGSMFHLNDKRGRLSAGEVNPFVDPDGYKTYLRESEQDFRNKLDRQKAEQ